MDLKTLSFSLDIDIDIEPASKRTVCTCGPPLWPSGRAFVARAGDPGFNPGPRYTKVVFKLVSYAFLLSTQHVRIMRHVSPPNIVNNKWSRVV